MSSTDPQLPGERQHPAISVRGLSKTFKSLGGLFVRDHRAVHAVTDLSFDVAFGETVAIVGESGSGKTTTARTIIGLERPTTGEIMLDGRPLPRRPRTQDRRELARFIQMVFQDPYLSLDPRQSPRRMLDEVLRLHTDLDERGRLGRTAELLEAVGLPTAKLRSLPSELSGGQRQRAAIARALASEPRVLILDEAVSALDTSVQAQILNLLGDLRERLGLTYVLISHDLAVVRYLADRVIVMYRGAAVEEGPVDEVLFAPVHPYTIRLLECVPRPGMTLKRRMAAVHATESSSFEPGGRNGSLDTGGAGRGTAGRAVADGHRQ